MDSIKSLRTFLRLAENGSFSQSAKDLSLSQASVSKHVAGLEDLLKAKLFTRTTRSLKITEAGERFKIQARMVVSQFDAAIGEVRELKAKPSGVIRMSSTSLIGRKYLAPMLAEFMERNPEISVDHYLGDSMSNLVLDGLDLTIRLGQLPDSTLRAQKIGSLERITAASRAFVKKYGHPKHPSELKALPCLLSIGHSPRWEYRDDAGKRIFVTVKGHYRADSTEALRSACLHGLGIFRGSTTAIDEELKSKKLVRLFPGFELPSVPVYAVTPSTHFLPEKVRVLIEFLGAKLKAEPVFRADGDK